MVRKVQRGGLDAITISASGLTFIDKNLDCLAVPLLINSYEELDYVRDGVTPQLEEIFQRRKLKLLSWAEAGWLYFFSTSPIRTPDDLRQQRLWTATGQPHLETLYKQFGINAVPLPANEMLTALQTGLIDVIDVPPLFALLDNSYRVAKHMTDLRWAPFERGYRDQHAQVGSGPEAISRTVARERAGGRSRLAQYQSPDGRGRHRGDEITGVERDHPEC